MEAMEIGGEGGGHNRQVDDGSVDYRGRTALRASTGGWVAAFFIIGEHLTSSFSVSYMAIVRYVTSRIQPHRSRI